MKNVDEQSWITGKPIEDLLKERDQYEIDSIEWLEWNELKMKWLEHHKPSVKEDIIYFEETSVLDIPLGFTAMDKLPIIPYQVERRSFLEYHPEYRHPIPYVIVKHKDQYFFILREKGSGEIRLIGKKGMLGGHVGSEDINEGSLSKTILNGLMRELEEEAGIHQAMISAIDLRGLIKSNEGVDADHLGLIYEVELSTDEIDTQEEGVLKGVWLHKSELKDHVASFESWSKIVYDSILKERVE